MEEKVRGVWWMARIVLQVINVIPTMAGRIVRQVKVRNELRVLKVSRL